MAPRSTFPFYDRQLGGGLSALLRDLVAAGNKPPAIRDALRDDHEVDVSVETVRRWLADLAPMPEHAA